jgi:hypothetical protein
VATDLPPSRSSCEAHRSFIAGEVAQGDRVPARGV